jgi:hypothetical protein
MVEGRIAPLESSRVPRQELFQEGRHWPSRRDRRRTLDFLRAGRQTGDWRYVAEESHVAGECRVAGDSMLEAAQGSWGPFRYRAY